MDPSAVCGSAHDLTEALGLRVFRTMPVAEIDHVVASTSRSRLYSSSASMGSPIGCLPVRHRDARSGASISVGVEAGPSALSLAL